MKHGRLCSAFPRYPLPRFCSTQHSQISPVQNVALTRLNALEENAFEDGKQRMRDKETFKNVTAHFIDKIRTVSMTPAWLPHNQLQSWLNKQVKTEKQKRAVARFAETRAANSTQDPTEDADEMECEE
eukprot:FR740747.1.p1 GENE.FR740747.1~~FR740747.1.p1  ORF type:complete len:128 (+),score=10.20 FR740747.1:147-530(+)